MFKKHNWMKYGKDSNIVNIQIQDSTGRKIDNFKSNNPKEAPKIAKILKDKYGWDFTKKEDKEDFKKELSEAQGHWLKKDMLWD